MTVIDFLDLYDTFLIDIHGVLYDGACVPEYAKNALRELHNKHKKVIIVSNSSAPAETVIKQTEKFGLLVGQDYDDIVTSGTVMRNFVSRKSSLIIQPLFECNNGIFSELTNVTYGDSNSDFAYLGIPKYNGRDIDIDDLYNTECDKLKIDELLDHDWNTICNSQGEFVLREIYSILLKLKALMLCANPDTFAFGRNKAFIRQGLIALKYEQIGGHVIYSGKPYRMIYDYIFARYNLSVIDKVAMIGDTPWTDIAGANNAGIDSILVKTGSYQAYLRNRGITDTPEALQAFLSDFSSKVYPKEMNFLPTHVVEHI